jgi:UDP-glucose 4-epimerase
VSGTARLLVTGGAGFVGANLVRRLGGRYDVRVLDSLVTGSRAVLPPEVELVVGDIRDPGAVDGALAGADAVVHLAAAGSVVDSVADPFTNFDVNARGTLTVLDAARRAGVERVVVASTGGALVGNAPGPVDESSVPRPLSPYGAGKAAAEAYCSAYAGSYGLRTIALRFANLYGPFSAHKKGVVTAFFRALHGGRPMVVHGDGGATRDFLHVADICDALERSLTADVPGGTTLHVATAVETSIDELAALCAEAAGRPGHPVEHSPARTGEVERNVASYRLAEQVLGFRPSVALRDGLAGTWEWYREHVFR